MFNYQAEIAVRRMERERRLKSLELQHLSRWIAFSERLDRLIEASVASDPPAAPVPDTAPRPAGLRAGIAAAVARVARAVDPEAASAAVRSPLEGQA